MHSESVGFLDYGRSELESHGGDVVPAPFVDDDDLEVVALLLVAQRDHFCVLEPHVVLEPGLLLCPQDPGVDEPGEGDQESIPVLHHQVQKKEVGDILAHPHFVVQLVGWLFREGVSDLEREEG